MNKLIATQLASSRAFLRGERLTGPEVSPKNRLRTDQMLKLILTHFPITDDR
jgi:hypothetical protein